MVIARLISFFRGYVYVEVYGQKKERFINLCSYRDVEIWNIRDIENGYGFYIYVKHIKQLRYILRKTHMKILIKERHGLPFFLFKHRKRKAFVLGISTAFAIIYFFSLFIWDITIEGNYTYTKYELLNFLEANNIYHGIRKSQVNCDEIEKLIRNQYFDVTWVSVEINGTRIIVHIKENFNMENEDDDILYNQWGYSIIAGKDAFIDSIITRAGTPVVKAGEQVEKGDLLIDGKIAVTGDYDEFIRTNYVTADGDVYGLVTYDYYSETDRSHIVKMYSGQEKKFISLGVMDYNIDFKLGNIEYEQYDIVESKSQLSLVKDFVVPVFFTETVCREYTDVEALYSDDELNALENEKMEVYLQNLSEKGIQIIQNDVKIVIDEDCSVAEGQILCIEEIGTLVPIVEEIENEKGSDAVNE